jgi:hypothetical protein
MRLGDLDALREVMEFHPTSMSVCMTVEEAKGRTAQKMQCLKDIDNAPTIDAVPVEWMDDRANDITRAPLYRRYAQMLMDEWQKEQEAR